MPSFGNTNPGFGSPTIGSGGTGNSNTSVAAQATQRRQLALQQCQGMSGSSQADCVRAADDAFARDTGAATLAQGGATAPATGGVAGSVGSTPDISTTTPPNNIIR